uniref:Uncharacterized protein n=1 Tax=Strongyloides stercoralis TaxID=6248 RepID=A0A0K0EAP4_STRER
MDETELGKLSDCDDEEDVTPEAPELKDNCNKLIENMYKFDKLETKLRPFKTGNGFYLMATSKKKFKLWLPQMVKLKKPNLLKMRRRDLHLVEENSKVIKKQIHSSLLSQNDFNNLVKRNN